MTCNPICALTISGWITGLHQPSFKASKTDLFCHGATLYIGATNGLLCPVAAVLKYMVERGNATGLVFKINGRIVGT